MLKKKRNATSEGAVKSTCKTGKGEGGVEEHWASEKHLMTSRKRQCEGACDLWVFRSTNTVRDGSRSSYAFTLCSQSKHVHLPQAGTQLTAKCCLSLCWHLSPKLMWLDLVPLFCTISSALFVYQASSTNHVPLCSVEMESCWQHAANPMTCHPWRGSVIVLHNDAMFVTGSTSQRVNICK